MKRITPEVKAIADAHIIAQRTGKFDDVPIKDKEELFSELRNGKTFSSLMEWMEMRHVSITSSIYAKLLDYQTEAYKKAIYKGFKQLFTQNQTHDSTRPVQLPSVP